MSYQRRGNMRMKRRKRTSAKSRYDPDKEINVAVKTGKSLIGYKQTARELATGKLKLIVLARNTRKDVVDRINLFNSCLETPVPVFTSQNSSIDLGAVLGKPYWVSCLGIIDEGDSSILKTVEKIQEQEGNENTVSGNIMEGN